MTTAAKAQTLVGLYDAPEILRVVNVWDVVSARAVAALPETQAIATAGHGIAASFGYDDGATPREIMIDMVGRIAAAVHVPVTADLDDGYGDAGRPPASPSGQASSARTSRTDSSRSTSPSPPSRRS